MVPHPTISTAWAQFCTSLHMVLVPDAVVQPRAVVVHLEDASVAHGAMVRPRGLRGDALLADGDDLREPGRVRGRRRPRAEGDGLPVVEDDVDEEELAGDDEGDGKGGVLGPVVGEADEVGDGDHGGVEREDGGDEAGPEDLGEVVHQPDERFDEGVERVGEAEVLVVEVGVEGGADDPEVGAEGLLGGARPEVELDHDQGLAVLVMLIILIPDKDTPERLQFLRENRSFDNSILVLLAHCILNVFNCFFNVLIEIYVPRELPPSLMQSMSRP